MALRDIQSNIQKAKAARDKQLVASNTATQSGSTSTPTTTETPKVVQPVKTQDVAQQRMQSNISNIKNIRSAEVSNIPDLFDKQSEGPYQSHLSKWFWREPWEKTQWVVTNLFDKLRPTSEKITSVWESLKEFWWTIRQEAKTETMGFDKWYTPEWLKQYFNYWLDELSPLVRPMVWNAWYTSLDTVKWVTNWINNTIDSISSRIPDEWLLVRKWILESSKTQEEIEADKERKAANREAIAASILDTVNAWEKWLDNTEIWKEVKSVEWKSLVEAIEQWDTESARRIIWNNIWYMLPSIWAGIVWWDVWVAASIFPVTYQDTLEDYMSDESILKNSTPEEIHWMATASSALQTAIEIISLETQVLKPLRKSTASKELSRKITQPVISRVIWQWLKWSLAEWAEEISQQFIEEKFAQLLGSNRELLTVDDYANIWLEAFIMWLIITWPWAVVEWVSTKRQKIVYNENIRKIKEAIPWITEEEAEEILNTIIDYEEKKEDITKLENKVTKLYDNKQNIQTTINELQQNPTDQNKYQIQLLEKKIQDIDENISKIDKKINDMYQPMQDVNDRLNKDVPTQEDIEQTVKTSYENMRQSELDRLKAWLIPWQQTTPQQQWWENLSKQTMRTIKDREDENNKKRAAMVEKKWNELFNNTQMSNDKKAKWFANIYKAAKKSNPEMYNRIGKWFKDNWYEVHDYDWELFDSDLFDESEWHPLYNYSDLFWQEEWWTIINMLSPTITKDGEVVSRWKYSIDKDKSQQSKEWQKVSIGDTTNIRQWQSFKDFYNEVTTIKNYNNLTEQEKDNIVKYISKTKTWKFKTSPKTWLPIWNKSEILKDWTINTINNELSSHLVWLSDSQIKDIKDNLTPEQKKEIEEMFAMISTDIWIDFNAALKWRDFWLSFTEWVIPWEKGDTKWEMFWNDDKITKKLTNAWIVLTIREWKTQAASTLAHELAHVLDVAWAFDNLETPTYTEWWYRTYHSLLESKATWELMPKWETYNHALNQKEKWLKQDSYLNDPTEVWARYNQQYMAFLNDKKLFNEMTGKDRFWSEEEFKKLLDDYYDILDNQLWKYRMSEGNAYYRDVMMRLDEYKKNWTLMSDKEWMQNIRDKMSKEEFDDMAANRMLNMQKEYVELSNELDKLEWDISNEMKAEYETTLDALKQNMDMLAQLWKEYMEFTSKRITLEDSKKADESVQSSESEMWETRQEISEEDWQLEADEELQNETTEEELNKQEEPEKEKVNTFKEDYEAYLKEKDRQKKWEFKENSKECRRDIWTVAKNILTPTMTRIYNINKRIAWRLTQMETQTWINIYRYTQKTQWFADTFNGLSKWQQLEVSKALFNFWALAKEQTEETLQEYKDNEKKKLRDVLTKNWFKDEDIDNLFEVLNDLWTRYKEAWMDITVTDMYFPRTVSDYKWLIRYLNEHSETPIQWKNARTIYNEIKKITEDPTLSDVQKESEIRRKLSENFSPKVSTKTKYSEERQLWLLSDWWAWIYAYYENPVESLASYITSMEQAIQRQLFLWWMKDTQWIDIDIKWQSSDKSVSAIVRDMFEKWQITESQMNELHTCLMAVLNKKWTPRWVRMIKDITYTMALTNYISAMNQAEDIWVAIIENKKWLISVLKSIFTKAWIKYDEAWLESAYEMFKTNSKPSDWLFKKSWFNAIDRMGKRSFLNAAWNSMVQTYKNPKARWHMYERLKAMYWDETANHIMECVRTNNFMNDWEIDIDVLTDLLYQLWNTQPIYQSSMPVSYLQHPEARWLYSLSMFSLRQIDHIIQSTKSAYEEWWVANAAYVWFKLITARMFFNALIWWVTSLLQWDLDDSWIWKLFEWDWEWAWKLFWWDMLKWFLKMWMFSKYDWNVRKNEWLWAFATNRISPYILQEWFKWRRAVQKALKNDDRKELMTMMRDVPLLWKQAYWRWKYYQDNILVDPFDKAFDDAFDQAFDGAFDEAFDNAFDEAFDKSFDKSFDKAFK